MSYSFWETAGGQRFTEYTVPALTDEIRRFNEPKQKTEVSNKNAEVIARLIDDYNKNGWILTHSIDCDTRTVLVFQKR